MRVRIASYNVLSTGLAKDHEVQHASFVSHQYRMQLLQGKLQAEAAAGAIICLQEVSLLWMKELTAFFAGLGYQFICAPYGKPDTMHMGVGVAFPFPRFRMDAACCLPACCMLAACLLPAVCCCARGCAGPRVQLPYAPAACCSQ